MRKADELKSASSSSALAIGEKDALKDRLQKNINGSHN